MYPPIPQLFLAGLTGLTLHWTYFVNGEHDLYAANIARFHVIFSVAIIYIKYQYEGPSIGYAIQSTGLLFGVYATALLTSIAVYRLFASPLRRIPGPLGMRTSKLVHVWKTMDTKIQNCKMLDELRKKHGDIVRTGPNEVTLFGYEAYSKVHGPESKCGRAAYYDMFHPMVSLVTTRDPEIHAYRRKLWDQAFSIKALEQKENIVYEFADKLLERLRLHAGTDVNIRDFIEYYTFDLTGFLHANIKFNCLEQQEHPILAIWHIAHTKLGPLNAAPWIKHLLMGLPFVERLKYYRQFMTWTEEELGQNIQNNTEDHYNLFDYVISDARDHGGVKKNWNFILGDFLVAIAAGSDPVRQVLTNMVYYLIQHPKHIALIRRELGSIDIRNYRDLQRLQHLNSCIYETLRINPVVPSAGLRTAPEGGITINETQIPEGTTLVTPQYSLHRDGTCFVRPDEWIPERFTTKPELVLNKSAFVAWSIGKMSCLGKNLSLLETRVAVALLVNEFDMELSSDEDGSRMFTEMTDYFTTSPGPLRIVLKSRKTES
ncbi:hypothetical protein ANO14919_080670 [Xylariales sp. No.14919]|nr:hypothetical protein ANO14919_080670 [Xylariales sp. No.14919]